MIFQHLVFWLLFGSWVNYYCHKLFLIEQKPYQPQEYLQIIFGHYTYQHVDISFNVIQTFVFKRIPVAKWLVNTNIIHVILRSGDCNITLSTTHCCSNVSMERIYLMNLVIILDFTHLEARDDLPLVWKHKHFYQQGVI